jgi:hypothetical protein
MSQRSFASAEYAMKKKRTRREKFLGEMERIVPWARLIAVIEPLYPTSGRVGRQPIGVSRMLRMYCLQQWDAAHLIVAGAIHAELPICALYSDEVLLLTHWHSRVGVYRARTATLEARSVRSPRGVAAYAGG